MGSNMKYKVIISDRAKIMLAEHVRFMAQVDKKAALKMKNEIVKAIKSLDEMPQRYPFFNEPYIPPYKYRKMFIKPWYLVLYQIQDDIVYADYILDTRTEYSFLFRG